jgi:hypothetical protein
VDLWELEFTAVLISNGVERWYSYILSRVPPTKYIFVPSSLNISPLGAASLGDASTVRLFSRVTVASIPNASFTPIGMTIDNARKNKINLICKDQTFHSIVCKNFEKICA